MTDILSSPIAEMHSGLIVEHESFQKRRVHDHNDNDNNVALTHFTEALAELASYLAPNSEDTEESSVDDVEKASNGNLYDNSISEITAYVSSVICAYESAAGRCTTTSSDISSPSSSSVNDVFLCSIRHINETLFDVNETSIVREHASLNLTHCRKLLSWLRRERMPWLQYSMGREDLPQNIDSEFRTFVQEYFDWASGPWRDVVLLDFLLTMVVPPLLRICIEETKVSNDSTTGQLHVSTGKDDVDVRSPSTETEKEMSVSDEASDLLSILSINGTRRKGHGNSHKASAMVIQKLKTDVAVLKAALEKSNMTDIDRMEDKLRRTTNETTKLKSLNNEMRSRISLLEEELYHVRNPITTGTLRKSKEKMSNLPTSTISTSTIAKEIKPSSNINQTNLVEISPRKNISVQEGIRIYDPKNPSSIGGKRSPKISENGSGSGSSGPDDDEFSDAMALDDLPSPTIPGHPRHQVSTVAKVFASVRMSRTMDVQASSSNTVKVKINTVGYESDIGKRRNKSVHPLLVQKEQEITELEATNKRLRRTLSICEERMSVLQDKLDEAQSRTVPIDSSAHLGIPSVVDFIPNSSGITDMVTLSVPPPAPPSMPPPNDSTSIIGVGKKQMKDKRVNFADTDLPGVEGWVQQAVGEILAVLPTMTDVVVGTSPIRASTVAGIPMPRPKRTTSKNEISTTVTTVIAQAIHLAKKDDEKMIAALVGQVKRLTNILTTEQLAAIEDSDGEETQDNKAFAYKETIYFHEFESVTIPQRKGKDSIMRWKALQKANEKRYALWLETTVSPRNEKEKKTVSLEKVLSSPLINDTLPPSFPSSPSSFSPGFSVIHLLVSFFLGLLFMLLVVSVSHWVALKYFAHMLLK